MPKIAYIEKKFSPARLAEIAQANVILDEYQTQGFDLTLRQLYYQFVSRGLIENNLQSYKRLGDVISEGRLAGLIDWTRIVDRTRNLVNNSHWTNPGEIMKSAAASFRLDKWANQPYRVECWIEKDALRGVIDRVCSQLDIPHFSCRGYTSISEMWVAARRLQYWIDRGQTPVILHLGDHDPSGVDMTRDIFDRLKMFMGGTEVKRLALNWDQINLYNPPPNPAKLTDSRAQGYIAKHGDDSWELDALEPSVIAELIRNAVEDVRDEDLYQEMWEEERRHRELLETVSKRWADVANVLG